MNGFDFGSWLAIGPGLVLATTAMESTYTGMRGRRNRRNRYERALAGSRRAARRAEK